MRHESGDPQSALYPNLDIIHEATLKVNNGYYVRLLFTRSCLGLQNWQKVDQSPGQGCR